MADANVRQSIGDDVWKLIMQFLPTASKVCFMRTRKVALRIVGNQVGKSHLGDSQKNTRRWLTCIHRIRRIKIDGMKFRCEDVPMDLFRIVRHDRVWII